MMRPPHTTRNARDPIFPLRYSRNSFPVETLKEIIATANTPNSIGPYSQAIKANGFIFV
jgi:hypothetical protein